MAKKKGKSEQTPKTKRYLRAGSSDRHSYPLRLTPENYEAVSTWSSTSGQSVNSLFNGMVQAFAATADSSEPSQTLQQFIETLGGEHGDSNQVEEHQRKGKGTSKGKARPKAKPQGH